MVALLAVVAVVGYSQSREEKPLLSRLPAPVRPLFKPTPGDLLTRSGLKLTDRQRTAIRDLDKKLLADRAKLMEGMSSFEPKRGRVDQISGSLADYAQLSRAYDATRSHLWMRALNVLDRRQRSLVEEGTK